MWGSVNQRSVQCAPPRQDCLALLTAENGWLPNERGWELLITSLIGQRIGPQSNVNQLRPDVPFPTV
jgi:hypothetical protein